MDEKEKKSSKNSKETSDTKAKTTKKSTKKDESVIEKQVKVNGGPVSISVPNPAGDNQKDGMNINLTINLASEEKKKRTTSTTRKKPTKKKTTKKKKSKAKSKAKTKEKKKSRWWLLLLLLLLLLAVVFYFVYPHKHEFSADWVTDAENHWHKCTGCEEVSDNATHTYDNDCDSDCNVCGYVRVAPHSYGTTYENNETTHWQECSSCHTTTTTEVHIYSGECDTTCNVCGCTRTVTASCTLKAEWFKDADNHWHECEVCGAKADIASHTFMDGTCSECRYEREQLQFSYIASSNTYSVIGKGRITSTDIVIPEKYNDGSHGELDVASIGNDAFIDDATITSVAISSKVTTIGDSAFSGCTNLSSVTMADGVTKIEDSAFLGCTNLSSVTFSSVLETIGWGSFYGCTSLTQVTLADKLETIGLGAFLGCTNLSSVTLESVKEIQSGAFSQCPSLTSITLPEGLETIEWVAFGESGITSINIPASVTSIGLSPFFRCKMETITVSAGNTKYKAINNCLIDIANTKIIAGTKNSIIPTDSTEVTMIEEYAFVGTELTSLVIPNNITTLSKGAFGYCDKLTSIVLPNGLTTLNVEMFYKCTSLKSIVIPSTMNILNKDSFTDCQGLEDIFYGGASLTEWNGITFYDATDEGMNNGSFDTATIYYYRENFPQELSGFYWHYVEGVPTPWETHSAHIYDNTCDTTCNLCGAVRTITHSYGSWQHDEDEHWKVCSNCNAETAHVAHTFKNGICDICEYARDELSFTYLSATDTYEVAGKGRIKGTAISIPATYDDGTHGSKSVTGVGANAFKDDTTITSVTFPASITNIGENAFYGCTGFDTLALSSTDLTTIGKSSFRGCTGLTSVTFPTSLENFGQYSFYGCTGLESINLSSTAVSTIGSNAFNGCTGLESVTFPTTTLSTIDSYAFNGCSSLASVTMPNSVTSVKDSAFLGCTSLASVTLSTGLEMVDQYVFFNCSSLTNITIPSNIKIIKNGAFNNCSALTTINFEEGLETIDGSCFVNCTSLDNVVLPSTVEIIELQTFGDCSNLTSIVIPLNVTKIGTNAFAGCNSLNKVYYGGSSYTEWDNITVQSGNNKLLYAIQYFYSETQPTEFGQYWHFVDGVPTEWPAVIDYSVQHYKEKLDGTFEPAETENLTGVDGTTANATIKTYDGFVHDTTNADRRESGTITSYQTLTLKVYYKRITSTLTLTKGTGIASVSASGDGVTSNSGTYTIKYGATVTLTATASTGYTFNNFTSSDVTISSNSYTHGTDDVTITANATANTYTITFSGNATDDTISISSTSANVTYATAIGTLPTATRTGYEFGGWFVETSGTTQITATTELNSTNFATIDHTNKTLTVYAKWTACTYGEWQHDEDEHWKVCSNCNAETAHVAHTFKNEICDVCEYARDELSFSYDGDTNSYTVIGIGRIKGTDIVIPATYDDGTNGSHPVKSVNENAFQFNSNITSVVFSENMEMIGDGAFTGCESLTSVTLSSTIKEIGTWAFAITGLTSINIPASVETIGDNPFMMCEDLTTITVNTANTKFHVNNSCLIDTVNKKIITGLSYSNIPSNSEEVTMIGYSAFWGISSGIALKIPSNITTIDKLAFKDCASIVSVEFPVSITIKEQAFSDCTSLITIYYAGGSRTEWSNNVTLAAYNSSLTNSTRYYYSENEPTTTGKYWNYVDSVATPWTEKMTYKVEHHIEKLDGSFEVASAETENKIGNINSTANATAKTITGFTHTIIEGSSKESGTITADGNLTLKLYYKRVTSTLTLTKGTGIATVSATGEGVTENSGTYTVKYGASVTLSATASTGYSFSSWTGYTVTDNSFTMPAENVTLTANATANTNTAYKVEHYQEELAGGTYIVAETENLTGTTGATVTATAKTDYDYFTHDTTNTNRVESGTIAGDGTLTLRVYYKRKTGTLLIGKDTGIDTVSASGTGVTATTGTATYTRYSVKYGATVTLTATASTGYTLAGWEKGAVILSGNTYTHNALEIMVTAKATENTYTIAFNNNGGTGEMASLTNVAYSENKTLTANTFEKEGYTFLGWATSSTATTATYTDGQSVNKLATGGTVTLYAVWQDDSSESSGSGGE